MSELLRRSACPAGSLLAFRWPVDAFVADGGHTTGASIGTFIVLVASTLLITHWAAKRTRTRADFYVAHGRITPLQNGLAIAGEFVSAGTFLGTTALFFSAGPDAFIYLVGGLTALSIILFVVGQRLRHLGRYTFVDVCALRFNERPIRIAAAANTLAILLLMMVGQLVGGGALIEILFGIRYEFAVLCAGLLMTVYVMFGGMYATTWVQIVKATLLLVGGGMVAGLVLARFDFSLDALLAAAASVHARGAAILAPGGLVQSAGDAISLGLTLALGSAGLPHLLMRFFTVKDERAASRSIVYATLCMGYFYLLLAIFGYGATALLTGQDAYMTAAGTLRGGDNMAVLHLTRAIGGPLLFGAMAAIIFATVLAVISGLCLSAAATVSHDLYARTIRKGVGGGEHRELVISRIAVACFAATGMMLAVAFKEQNIVFTVALGVSIAASANFPALMASMYWRRATTCGVVAASIIGLTLCAVLMLVGPTIWVGVLHHSQPLFPYQYPTVVSLPCAVLVLVVVSTLDKSTSAHEARLAFDRLHLRALTGIEPNPDVYRNESISRGGYEEK